MAGGGTEGIIPATTKPDRDIRELGDSIMRWDEVIMLPLNAVRDLFGRPPAKLYETKSKKKETLATHEARYEDHVKRFAEQKKESDEVLDALTKEINKLSLSIIKLQRRVEKQYNKNKKDK